MSNLEDQLVLVRDGQIDFGEFVAHTRREFRAMAINLTRRWTPPEWFTLSDLEQELYLGAWNFVWRHDPTRGASLSRYVVYNAMNAGKRQLHMARGVTLSGNADKRTSNIEVTASVIGSDNDVLDSDFRDFMEIVIDEDGQHAEEILVAEATRKESVAQVLRACESKQERCTVLAIRDAGSLDAAGRLLYDDMNYRIALRLSSEEHADRFVLRHARAVARRVGEISVNSS